jgi:hypothetical protein
MLTKITLKNGYKVMHVNSEGLKKGQSSECMALQYVDTTRLVGRGFECSDITAARKI